MEGAGLLAPFLVVCLISVISVLVKGYFMIFEFSKKIYGFDCDVYGHLNNACYLQIYEAARAEALNSMGMPIAKLKKMSIMLFLIRVEIDYLKGVELEDTITVKSRVVEHNRLKSIWKQEIYDSTNRLCSRAVVTGVYVSEGKPVRIEKELFEYFDKFVEVLVRG